jgi:invasion protein IalB
MLSAMLAAVALLADATPAAAAAPAQPAAKPAPTKKADDIVCHKEAQLGTSIPTKVCYSRAEYEANKAESRRTLEHVQNNLGIRGN